MLLYHSDPSLLPQDHYWVRLCVNLFSVQGFQGFRVQFGSNPALWSIGYEFFYYIMFGLIFFWKNIFRSKIKLASALVLGLFFIAGIKIALYSLIWFLGLISYRIQKSQKKIIPSSRWFWISLLVVLLINHYVVYKALGDSEYLRDFLLGLAVAGLLIPKAPVVGAAAVHKFMADFSYTLYAFHMPILFFAYFVILDIDSNFIKLFSMIVVMICIGFAWLFSIITEKKRFLLRRLLMKLMSKDTPESQYITT